MKYFITGGAGCIGSHMADALMERGEVTVYDNLSSGKLSYLAHHREKSGFKFVEGDVGDLKSLTEAMAGHDTVFHFASNPDIARSVKETDLDLREGTILTYNVLEAMRINRVGKLLYSSGSGIYGDVGDFPTPEDFGPLLPISMYGASKLACEGLISAFCHMFGMTGCIYRFANVVGSRQTHGVGYDFIRKLKENPRELLMLGDGEQSKSYVHVSDVIGAMLFVEENAPGRVNLFNVATDDYITVRQIAGFTIEEMGLPDVAVRAAGGPRGWEGDVPVVRFDLTAIHQLGWKAKYNSEAALRLSIQELLEESRTKD